MHLYLPHNDLHKTRMKCQKPTAAFELSFLEEIACNMCFQPTKTQTATRGRFTAPGIPSLILTASFEFRRPVSPSAERLVHSLVRQFDTQESSSVGRDGSGECGSKAGEERLDASLPYRSLMTPPIVTLPSAVWSLLLTVSMGKTGYPHSNAGGGTRAGNGRQTELTIRLSGDRIPGC